MQIISLCYSTCVLSGKVRNLPFMSACSVLRVLTGVSIQCCAFPISLLSLAILDAALLEFKGGNLKEDLGSPREH